MKCQNCGAELVGDHCPHCGQSVLENRTICSKCKTEYTGNFCPNCGQSKDAAPTSADVSTQSNAQPPINIVINNENTNTNTAAQRMPVAKNKWVAFLLCLFLGEFGAHKFYERKYLLGVLYIFTFGLFGIGWLVDVIALLFKPNPYYI